jgi:hypothetical protein
MLLAIAAVISGGVSNDLGLSLRPATLIKDSRGFDLKSCRGSATDGDDLD